MNPHNVVSQEAARDLTGQEYKIVTITSTGIDLLASGGRLVGTLLRAQPHQEDGVYAGKAVGIQLAQGSIHFAQIGASSAAVLRGAGLIIDAANPGQLIPSETNSIAIAWEAFTAAQGAIVRIVFL